MGRARAPFDDDDDGATKKAAKRREEFIIFDGFVKSSDGDRGGVDVHLRDGDIRRETSAAG